MTKADAERLKAAKVPDRFDRYCYRTWMLFLSQCCTVCQQPAAPIGAEVFAAYRSLCWMASLFEDLSPCCDGKCHKMLRPICLQLAPGRLANVADTVDGVLDPARYLKQGRHGDWTPVSGRPRGTHQAARCSGDPVSECHAPRVYENRKSAASQGRLPLSANAVVMPGCVATPCRVLCCGWVPPHHSMRIAAHGASLIAGSGPRAGPSWGVTSLPPGSELLDPRVRDAIQAQQRR